MLRSQITTIAGDWVDGSLGSRDHTLMNSRCMLVPGAGVDKLATLASEELRTIAATCWIALIITLRAMPPLPSVELHQDVQTAFTELLANRYQALLGTCRAAFEMSIGSRSELVIDIIQTKYASILHQYSAEIAMWSAAYELGNAATPAEPSYVFNSPVAFPKIGAVAATESRQPIGSTDVQQRYSVARA